MLVVFIVLKWEKGEAVFMLFLFSTNYVILCLNFV
jgi:hypothetical protein